MNKPRLEIYLNQGQNFCISKVSQQGNQLPVVDIPLDELKALGPENAAYRIGATVLDILDILHPQAFESFKAPDTKTLCDDENNSDYVCALKLISFALSSKTSIHNKSIEYFLQQAAKDSEAARIYLNEAWPLLRDRLK